MGRCELKLRRTKSDGPRQEWKKSRRKVPPPPGRPAKSKEKRRLNLTKFTGLAEARARLGRKKNSKTSCQMPFRCSPACPGLNSVNFLMLSSRTPARRIPSWRIHRGNRGGRCKRRRRLAGSIQGLVELVPPMRRIISGNLAIGSDNMPMSRMRASRRRG